MSILNSAGDKLGGIVPRNKFGYTGRARRLMRAGRRTGRALVARGLYPQAIAVRTYWWEREPNFGDLLTPLLLPDFGVIPLLTPAPSADLVGVGSLIQHLPDDFAGTLWGTGLIHDEAKPLPAATVLAVRGEMTLERIASPQVHALGDPGLLLAGRIRRTPARWDVGLVPHYIHRGDPAFARLLAGHSNRATVVNVRRHPLTVARHIAACRAVVTSSLHGLIVADSLGIPAVWVRSSAALAGGDFKFRDHETVARPARPRGHALADLESLDHASALAISADEQAISRARRGLIEAAGMIAGSTPHRTVNPTGIPRHAMGMA